MEYSFLKLLPKEIKQGCIRDFVRNKGHISNAVWDMLLEYLQKQYQTAQDYQLDLERILKEAEPEDRFFVKQAMEQCEGSERDGQQDVFVDLEDVLKLDMQLVKHALKEMEQTQIVKAVCIVSPAVKEYFREMYPEIDFIKMREVIGNIPVAQAEDAYHDLVHRIQANYLQ